MKQRKRERIERKRETDKCIIKKEKKTKAIHSRVHEAAKTETTEQGIAPSAGKYRGHTRIRATDRVRLMVRLATRPLLDGDDEMVVKTAKGEGGRENERGEARRAREASVVSVCPL